MKLPIAWLRDYVALDASTEHIVERLALLGFPVADVEKRTPLSGIVTGRLARVEKHPNADRLQVCTVDVAGPRMLTIATAATNVAEGQVVPVATIGAKLVGLEIGPRKMRGVDSEGMLVSASEIGLEGTWFEDGILQLERDLPLGIDFVDRFRLNDDVLDVEVTSNRVDAMSVLGLAHELGAAFGVQVRPPDVFDATAAPAADDARVTLQSPDCRHFVAQRFSGARPGVAPFWMRLRLALAGQRPIDALVDVSNFVMFETAQPLHFYDFATLAGGALVARDARDGERLRTLDGEERALDPRFLVIADEREVQGIAGLKGGAASEVTPATTELLLEAATFNGARVRRMSVLLGLRTEASSRHEKSIPAGLAPFAAARAAHLLRVLGATPHAPFAAGGPLAPEPPVRVTSRQINGLLGLALDDAAIERALSGLDFAVSRDDAGFTVSPPFWRGDVKIAEDVVEEIARVVGYDRIAAALPPVFEQSIASTEYDTERRIAHALAAQGYRETVMFSLQPASVRETYRAVGIELGHEPVEVSNPLSEDQRYLRFSLLPGALALAARHAGDEPVRLFEIGHVFEAGADGPLETAMAMWLLVQPRVTEPDWRDSGFLTFKGEASAILRALSGRDASAVVDRRDELHPGKTAALLIGGKDVAKVGAIDPRLLAAFDVRGDAYAAFVRLVDLPAYVLPHYAPASRFPAIARDLALVVPPETPAIDIEHAVRAGVDGVLADVRVFDEYRGPQVEPGKKSIAVRVVLQRDDATLTDAEADAYVAAIVASLRERVGATIRA